MYQPSHLLVGKLPEYTGWNSSAFGTSGSQLVSIDAVQRLVTGTDSDGFPVLTPATCWRCAFSFCSKTYANVEVHKWNDNDVGADGAVFDRVRELDQRDW